MARHRGRAHLRISGGVLAGVLVLTAAVGYAAMRAADRAAPPQSAGSTSSVTSVTSTSSAGSSTSVTTQPTPTAAGAALNRCAATVRAQETLAKAAAASARDWALHTDAQRKLDAGRFTVAQTKAQWADSKARGPADLKAFSAASAASKRLDGGCAGIEQTTKDSAVAAAGMACAARSAALARVEVAGAQVNRQWAAHMAMMANKEHTNGAAYFARWVGMVKEAQPTLRAYQAAAAALAKAPPCTTA